MATNSNGAENMDYYPLRPIESMSIQELQALIPKGDPGGITFGTAIGLTANWNDLTTDGVYRAAAATGLNKPPIAAVYGTVIVNGVEGPGTRITQTYYPATSGTGGKFIMTRAYAGGIWYPWGVMAATRVDQTAGRAIYQYDNVNDREQLIYGDTGIRALEVNTNVVSKDDNATFIRVRRTANRVEISMRLGIVAANGGGANVLSAGLPVGYRPATTAVTNPFLMEILGSPSVVAGQISIIGEVRAWYTNTSGTMSSTLSYNTSDAWPTTLPGAALGTIPNL